MLIVAEGLPGSRLVHSPTGNLEADTSDVRSFGDAARKGKEFSIFQENAEDCGLDQFFLQIIAEF